MKQIEGFNYYIDEQGNVYNSKLQRLKNLDNGRGYKCVRLYDGKKYHTKYIHRLVAEAFIPNPYNLPQINHKDENKENNVVSNLEWCDCKYNINYGTARQRERETKEKQGLKFGEEHYRKKLEHQREYSSRKEVKEHRKEYEKEHREHINAWMREYRKRRKEEGRPLP